MSFMLKRQCEWYQRNRDKCLVQAAHYRAQPGFKPIQAVRSRNHRLRTRYGIDAAAYDLMLQIQGGKCAICQTTQPGGKRQYLCIDHNHKTGKVRALLCQKCNILVSYAENPNLPLAIKYLEAF